MGHNNQKDVSKLFASVVETEEPEEVSVNGEFPQWLKGTIIQTGPGLLDLPQFTMNDYLDGYAILTKFEIGGQKAKLTKKYPETESYKKALEYGKPYFMEYGTTAKREGSRSGLFSKLMTTLNRDDMSDNCSASMYHLGRSLIAASETSFISTINPTSLCLEQRYDVKKLLGQNGYGVHCLVDDEGTMWNVGFSVLPTVKYNIIKIPRATSNDLETDKILGKGTTITSISPRWNGALSFNHSFGMTQNYIIFVEQPYVIKISRVLAATLKDYAVKDWLEWRGSEKNRFYIIEKATGKVHATEYLSSESFFFLHFINCYEEDGKIIVDIGASKTPTPTESFSLSKLRNNIIDEVDPFIIERYVIPVIDSVKSVPENSSLISPKTMPNTTAQAVRKGNSIILTPEILFAPCAYRTTINPRRIGKKHSIIYVSGSFLTLADSDNSIMAHSICKVNTETKETTMWTAPGDHILGDPIFIPRNKDSQDGDEDDGVIVCAASTPRANAKDLLVLIDGKSFKEVGSAGFKNKIPIGMHGIFIPE